MQRQRAAKKAQVLPMLAQLVEQLAATLDQSSDRSVPGTFVTQLGHDLSVATQRSYSRGQVVATLAQTLIHARWAWHQVDQVLVEAAARVDIFPDASTLIGKVLRRALATPLARGWGESPGPEWGPVEQRLQVVEAASCEFHERRSQRPDSLDAHHDFDAWLGHHDRRKRRALGVFYTPEELVQHTLTSIDESLRTEFGLEHGLADLSNWSQVSMHHRQLARHADQYGDLPFVRILDPALGTGVFLDRVVAWVGDYWRVRRAGSTGAVSPGAAEWDEFVSRHLLPRVQGHELMLPAAAIAWLRIATYLARTGCRCAASFRIPIHIADTLAGSLAAGEGKLVDDHEPPFSVVLGNPPFAALSTNDQPWIWRLMREPWLGGRQVGTYYEVDGVPLGERKHWLHDDYVKFFRYAQWHIERAGCGVVGYVTSHGFLDNVTFRGMRRSLLTTFPAIHVVDLHGNRKKREVPPPPHTDNDNVFGIDQGVCVAVLRRAPEPPPEPRVTFQELWGSRQDKLEKLATQQIPPSLPITPVAPYFFLAPIPDDRDVAREYDRGFSLPEIMPVKSSVAVTARDSLVVAFDPEELVARIETFRDPSMADAEIRRKHLRRTRSHRYDAGDSRSWKLPAARDALRQIDNLHPFLRPCLYRPFDPRTIFWSPELIDWPRANAMGHMLEMNNLALVTRRQMLSSQPCNYFFVCDTVVLDGLLRSDNRGNETFFPLYLASGAGLTEEVRVRLAAGHNWPIANFSASFIAECGRRWGLGWIPRGSGDLASTFGPEDVAALLYAQFHSEHYRTRYAEQLRRSFARVFLPRDRALLRSLCQLGQQLIQVHLLRNVTARHVTSSVTDSALKPHGRYPRYQEGVIHLSSGTRIEGVEEDVWNHRIGGHQVCRKWLHDRRHRVLTGEDHRHYLRVIRAIEETLRIQGAIDGAIRDAGGWEECFL